MEKKEITEQEGKGEGKEERGIGKRGKKEE